MRNIQTIHWTGTASMIVLLCGGPAARGNLIQDPIHPHNPSPVTTWAHDFLKNLDADPLHRHQHRTGHDPRFGKEPIGGTEPYKANDPDGFLTNPRAPVQLSMRHHRNSARCVVAAIDGYVRLW